MNLEELKTILTDIASSLESVLQALSSGDQAGAEAPAESLMESVKQFKEAIKKAEDQDPTPEGAPSDQQAPEPGKETETTLSITMKEILNLLKSQKTEKSVLAEHKVNKDISERIERIEKGFEEMLKGFGIKEQEQQPAKKTFKGLNSQDGQGAVLDMLVELLIEKSEGKTSQVVAGSNPIRKNVGQIAEGLKALANGRTR
jgi:hypothetical protein